MTQKILSLFFILTVCFIPVHFVAAQTADSPQEVTQAFYDWFLSNLNPEEGHNPFVQQLYQDSPYLTAGMIQKLDDLYTEGIRYDPIICAQSVPMEIRAEEISTNDTTAVVLLHAYFGESPMSNDMTVFLDQSEGSWKISDMRCEDLITPEGVVDRFYEIYTFHEGNPFLDGVYQDFEHITSDFVAQLDTLQTGTGLMQDPFFCGPEIPSGHFTETLWATDEEAAVLVHAIIGSGVAREMTVGTLRQNDAWYINSINCQTTPEEKVLHFYNRYVLLNRYYLDRGIERDVISDPTFFWLHYATPELEAELKSSDRLIDPVLCAQDLPETITTLPGDNQGEVRVQGTFAGGTSPVDLALVTVEYKPAEWIISSITCSTE